MMLLSTLVLSLLGQVLAAPTPGYSFSPTAALGDSTGFPNNEASEIAHLAGVVNDAYCSSSAPRSEILAISSPNQDLDLPTWEITSDSSDKTLYLAFTSPPPEDLLEILASVSPSNDNDHLAPLPPTFLTADSTTKASIYTPYLPYLAIVEEATESLSAQITLASNPPLLNRLLYNTAAVLGLPDWLPLAPSRPRIEIVGHGLGSVLGLLATTSLHIAHPDLTIRTTLFSMPKIGDEAFASAVDTTLRTAGTRLDVRRITYGEDILPRLPPAHYGLFHPTLVQDLHLDREEGGLAGGDERLEHGLGPYAGQKIGYC